MTNTEELYKLIQRANEEQTAKLAEVSNEQTKLLQEEIRKNIKEVNERVDDTVKEVNILKEKYIAVERKIRRNNIIIFGLEASNETLTQDTIAKLNALLNTRIVESDINNIYALGKNTKSPIILEFVTYLKKQVVFSQVTKLKGSGIAITNDLCYEDREDRKILRIHQRKAQSQNLEAKIKGNKLVIGDDIYTVEELKELEGSVYTDIEQEASEEEKEDEEVGGSRDTNKVTSGSVTKASVGGSGKRKRRKIVYSPKSKSATAGGNVLTRSQKKPN